MNGARRDEDRAEAGGMRCFKETNRAQEVGDEELLNTKEQVSMVLATIL